MPREVTIPTRVVHEEIALVEEHPSSRAVMVRVAMIDEATGKFDISLGIMEYTIALEDYDELVGPPTEWAPDKPAGTYRNDDLWHFIDKQRNLNA